MAIVKAQPGAGAFQAAAAKQTKSAVKKIREAELGRQEEQKALQLAMEARRLDQQREMSQFQAQLALEREKRGMAFELEKEDRARAWQLEKMEIASRMDFEQEERERLQYKAEYRAGKDTIYSNKNLTDTQQAQADFQLSMIYARKGVEEAAEGLGLKPQTQKTGLFNLGGEEAPMPTGALGVPTADNPLGLNITETAATPVSTLPQAVLALEQGNEFEVISPDGEQEIIKADQWPEYKSKGYILASIAKKREWRQMEAEGRRRDEELLKVYR